MQIDFQKTNTPFGKNVLFRVKKRINKPSQRKQILPTQIMLLFSDIVLSVSTVASNPNLIKLRTGRAIFKHFPGASSKDFLHYIDPTLEEQNFEVAIIHIWINDILYDSSSRQMNLLLQNIREIGKKCMSYNVKYVFISSLTFNNRLSHKLLIEVNEMM